MRLFAVLLICMPGLAAAQSQFTDEDAALLQQGLVTTADEFILPAYTAQSEATAELVSALDSYCDGTGEITAVHEGFAETFLAWQRASIIQIGPIVEAEGPMRVQLWPDPKGFARRAGG